MKMVKSKDILILTSQNFENNYFLKNVALTTRADV